MKKILFVLVISTIIFSSCGMFEDKDAAIADAEIFYKALSSENYETVKPLLSDKWFKETSWNTTVKFFNKVNTVLGPITNKMVISWNVNYQKNYGTGSGTYVELTYVVNRQNDNASESFRMFRPEGKDKFLVYSYRVNSKKLMDDFVS